MNNFNAAMTGTTTEPKPGISLVEARARVISDHTLAHLNISVFRQLRKLGTSKQRICAVLNLSPDEYDYVCTLT